MWILFIRLVSNEKVKSKHFYFFSLNFDENQAINFFSHNRKRAYIQSINKFRKISCSTNTTYKTKNSFHRSTRITTNINVDRIMFAYFSIWRRALFVQTSWFIVLRRCSCLFLSLYIRFRTRHQFSCLWQQQQQAIRQSSTATKW